MRAQPVSSASGGAGGTGSAVLATGSDSPVRTDSSHSSPVAVSSRRSAGTISPSARSTTSPGTRSVTSTRPGWPSRSTDARWRIWECSASAARSARYSLTNPSPTDASKITPMITASVRSPRKNEASAVTAEQDQQR